MFRVNVQNQLVEFLFPDAFFTHLFKSFLLGSASWSSMHASRRHDESFNGCIGIIRAQLQASSRMEGLFPAYAD
jgi:hypothetical protein